MVLLGCDATALASQSVELSWNPSASTNVVAYRVYYGTQSGVYASSITFADVTDVVIPALNDGQTYYFAVVALDASGDESPFSGEAVYTIPLPGALVLQVQETTSAFGAAELSWTPSSDGDVYGYVVSYGTQSGVYTVSATFYGATSGVISGLAAGTTYYFVVSPIDSYGVVPGTSAEVSYIVPVPPPIILSAQTATNPPGVALSWSPVPRDATVGYNIYYGTESGAYTGVVEVGVGTNASVGRLEGGQTYYFAVAPLDPFGDQGPLSSEASAITPAAPPIVLKTTTSTDSGGNKYIEIKTDSAVFGNWEMQSSTNLVDWTWYSVGYGSGNGDGYDIYVYVPVDPAAPQMFFRVVQ